MEKMTKVEMYQLLIGLIAAAVWAFGKKWELPVDIISFAGNAVVAVVGHAVGTNATKATPADTQVIQAAAPDAAIPVAAADPNVPK